MRKPYRILTALLVGSIVGLAVSRFIAENYPSHGTKGTIVGVLCALASFLYASRAQPLPGCLELSDASFETITVGGKKYDPRDALKELPWFGSVLSLNRHLDIMHDLITFRVTRLIRVISWIGQGRISQRTTLSSFATFDARVCVPFAIH